MDKFSFLKMISNPAELNSSDMETLANVSENFPYCQTSYILKAKASHNAGSMHYGKFIKLAAIYANNRSILKKIIENEHLTTFSPQFLESNKEVSFILNSNEQTIVEPIIIDEKILKKKQAPQKGPFFFKGKKKVIKKKTSNQNLF